GALSLTMPHAGGLSGALANVITTVSLTAGISIVAVIGNLWIRGRTQLATERQLSAEQLAKRQELEERNRIAQELHDVVAHSMSVISVQATTARYRLPELDTRSVDEFDSIAGSARQALNEMRGLLAILRGGRDADLAPQPMIDDIPDLVEATRGSGAEVELEFSAEPIEINPTTGLTAFRLVQEALSNALRHAPGAPVRVSVRTDEWQLSVSVVNGVPGSTDSGTNHPGSGQPDGGHLGGGFGLKGMRERVEALDGTLQVGPTAEGGFEVKATLPTS
ncbi:MAG: sensor histidine kinase, partial [Brevibacterium aurantiacum]